jgi:hypothetical protein
MSDSYVDNNAACKFARLNYTNFLDMPVIKKIDDKMTSIEFKIGEYTLQNTGINFLTLAAPDSNRFNIYRAWVIDAAQQVNGYGYFSGELLQAIDVATQEGVLNGAYAVPVKITLSDYDSLTGLQGKIKVLKVILHFYNDGIIPSH